MELLSNVLLQINRHDLLYPRGLCRLQILLDNPVVSGSNPLPSVEYVKRTGMLI